MKLGSHVSFKGNKPFTDAIKTAKSYAANAFMIYTGPPQSSKRKPLSIEDIENGHKLLLQENILLENIIVHAPYIINLANPLKPETRQFGKEFLIKEIQRCNTIGTKIIILHPGSHLKHNFQLGADYLIESLKFVFENTEKGVIALETMAGKGSELGRTFEEIKYLLDGLNKYKNRIKVCLDTCHIFDAGYDIKNEYEKVIKDFELIIGLDNLACIHINDSKNHCGSRKDRHENIGYGNIGFSTIYKFCIDKRFKELVKILETPYFNNSPPYLQEIKMLKRGEFENWHF